MKTDTPRPIRLKDYKPSPWRIETVTLDVSLHPTATRVKSRLKVKPNAASSEARAPLILDGEMLELESLKLDGKVLEKSDYDLTAETLILRKPPSAPAFNLEIVTHINPEANKALNGLYRSRGIYTTQCEAEGFRRITYFLDRPDILSTYVVRVEAAMEEASVLLANGNPSERGTLDRVDSFNWPVATTNTPVAILPRPNTTLPRLKWEVVMPMARRVRVDRFRSINRLDPASVLTCSAARLCMMVLQCFFEN